MTGRTVKTCMLKSIPYVFTALLMTHIGEAWRMSAAYGNEPWVMGFVEMLPAAFSRIIPSFHPFDLLTGIIVAAVFKASSKSENGGLDSGVGLKGLLRKLAMLCGVTMAYYLDKVAGTDFVRDATCLAFVCNEGLSIIENFGLMGVPIPAPIRNAIDVLMHNDKEGA